MTDSKFVCEERHYQKRKMTSGQALNRTKGAHSPQILTGLSQKKKRNVWKGTGVSCNDPKIELTDTKQFSNVANTVGFGTRVKAVFRHSFLMTSDISPELSKV